MARKKMVDGMRVAKVAGVSKDFDFCGGQFPADFVQS